MHANSHCVYSAIKDKAFFSSVTDGFSCNEFCFTFVLKQRNYHYTYTYYTIFSLFFFTKHVSSKETADTITMSNVTIANYPTIERASLEVLKTCKRKKTVHKTMHLTTLSSSFTAWIAHDLPRKTRGFNHCKHLSEQWVGWIRVCENTVRLQWGESMIWCNFIH